MYKNPPRCYQHRDGQLQQIQHVQIQALFAL